MANKLAFYHSLDELQKAIMDYCEFPHNQNFALMLSGAWGSGKTYFIKGLLPRLLRERTGEVATKAVYISLYGVADTEEIDRSVFEQLHPIFGSTQARLVGSCVRSALRLAIPLGNSSSLTASMQDINLLDIIKQAEGRIIVFDDFERALISPAAILGYINPLVEHEDCKVIIIADESHIESACAPDYEKRKEKTIGQRYGLHPI